MTNRCDIRIEWNAPDATFVATFLRNGAPWYLGGALVGMQETRDEAVADLIELADHLVLMGENFLTEGQIPLRARQWLFETLDWGNDARARQNRYVANRRAQEGVCANCGEPVDNPGAHLTISTGEGYRWTCVTGRL